MTTAQARQAVLVTQLSNRNSFYYQNLCAAIRASAAKEAAVENERKEVILPFQVDSEDVAALELQFSVRVKCKGSVMRARLTARVAGLMHCLDSAMWEHAGGGRRRLLFVDGDLVVSAVRGLDNRIIERTGATSRLVAGYAMEDSIIRNMGLTDKSSLRGRAETLSRELADGCGEHFCNFVRWEGLPVDGIVVNNFRTPVGPHQMAYLALGRRAPVFGCVPFQLGMLESVEGDLECFPGRYYIDKKTGMLTLVPAADATMSVSIPWAHVEAIALNNSITVGGEEFLLERYMQVPGVLFYTLKHVDASFEAPEVLRAYYFSPKAAEMTVLRYPKVKMSADGVPVGWERGEVAMLTSRYNKVLIRVQCSANKVVRPAEVFSALSDNNNLLLNSLDTAVLTQRMSVEDEEGAALAVALHVNYRRHLASGTMRALLAAVKTRYGVAEENIGKLAWLAFVAWLNRPDVEDIGEVDDLVSRGILDWCGNDFSVVAADVDPWVEVVQCAGRKERSVGLYHGFMPKPTPEKRKRESSPELVTRPGRPFRRSIRLAEKIRVPVSQALPAVTVVDEAAVVVPKPTIQLTDLKKQLRAKLVQEQAAVDEVAPDSFRMTYSVPEGGGVGHVPVEDVEPISTMRYGLLLANGGLPQRDVSETGYRLAELDVDKYTHGNLVVNDTKRVIPKARQVRKPVVDAGVEGPRVASQASLLAAVFKRNMGIPSNRTYVDLDRTPKENVQKMINVCFREGWEEVVAQHMNTGMWQANEEDIDDYLAGLDPIKARAMVDEYFSMGQIDLDRWVLMAKGKVKASRDPDAQFKVDHAQTIMYLENKSVNAYYSAMLRRTRKCLEACLRPEVQLNAQHNEAEHEAWDNSLNPVRDSFPTTYYYSSDIRCYDRSQEHSGLLVVRELYRRLGLDKTTLDKWCEMHGEKKAYSMMFGILISVVMCGVSGNWETLWRNGVLNLVAVCVACKLSYRDIVMLDIKGDDMDAEFSRRIDVEGASQLASSMFNMSAKISGAKVRYMCKTFRMRIGGRWYHMADPWPMVQSLCTPVVVGGPNDGLLERWISIADKLRYYDNGILVDAVAQYAQAFYGVHGLAEMAKALAAIKEDKQKFFRCFLPPVLVQ